MQDSGEILHVFVVVKKRSLAWIAILPALPFLLIGLYAALTGPASFIASADPSYNYLVNSYEVMTGAAPFAIHHPGTTLQYLMGLTNWISWLILDGEGGSFAYSVVSQPEWYLDIDLIVLILMQTAALAVSSAIIAQRWGIAASFAFSGGVLLLTASEFNLFLVGPVALSFALALLSIGLSVKIISGETSTKVSVLFGVVLICGVMNKATFMPMLALFGIYIFAKGFRAALGGAIAALILFLALIRDQIFHLGYWFVGLLSTTGRNPADVSSIPLSEKIINSPAVLARSMPWAVIIILIYLTSVAILFIHSKRNSIGAIKDPKTIISLIAVLIIAGSTLMTIKDYRQGDLIVIAAVAPLLLAFCFSLIPQLTSSPRGVLSSRVAASLIVVLSTTYFIGSQVSFARQEISADYLAEIKFLESKRSEGGHVALAYGVFTPGSALGFGDDLSNHLLARQIDDVYPRQLALSLETLEIQSRGDQGLITESCEALSTRTLSGSELIVAPGRPVDPQELASVNGATEAELVQSFGQWPVYRLTGFNCSAS